MKDIYYGFHNFNKKRYMLDRVCTRTEAEKLVRRMNKTPILTARVYKKKRVPGYAVYYRFKRKRKK